MDNLDDDSLGRILSKLDARALSSLQCACNRRLYSLTLDEGLWRRHCLETWPCYSLPCSELGSDGSNSGPSSWRARFSQLMSIPEELRRNYDHVLRGLATLAGEGLRAEEPSTFLDHGYTMRHVFMVGVQWDQWGMSSRSDLTSNELVRMWGTEHQFFLRASKELLWEALKKENWIVAFIHHVRERLVRTHTMRFVSAGATCFNDAPWCRSAIEYLLVFYFSDGTWNTDDWAKTELQIIHREVARLDDDMVRMSQNAQDFFCMAGLRPATLSRSHYWWFLGKE